MAPHSSILAWKIAWTEEPGGLQSTGSPRVGHDGVTSLSLPCIGEGNGNPLWCSCLENPRDGGAWWAAVYGVAQNRTWLKRLSSSSLRAFMHMIQYHWYYYNMTVFLLVTQLCQTLLQPMDCGSLGSSVLGFSQARILEWVAISFPRGSSQTRDQICVSCIGRQILYYLATREAPWYSIISCNHHVLY